MENQLQIFNNPDFGTIRTIFINGEIWFVAVDVCRALDLGDTSMAVSRLKDNEKGTSIIGTLGGNQQMLIVNEPGLYHLIFTSRKPEAEKFQDWVYHEVLPKIRKYGYYAFPNIDAYIKRRLKNFIEIDKDKEKLEGALPALTLQCTQAIENFLKDFEENRFAAVLAVEDLPGEIWKDIKGYNGLYQVSNRGRVKSFQSGKVTILTQWADQNGYMHVTLCKNGKHKQKSINRLVAQAFLANPNNLPVVHHKDNNPANNDESNLKWTTGEGNREYAVQDRRYKSGEDHPRSKLTEEQVLYICKVYIPRHPEFGQSALARKFGVSKSTIRMVITGTNWKYTGTEEERQCTPNTDKKPVKLTEEQVRWIREHYIPRDPEYGQNALAKKFNVSRTAIELIVQGKNWKHVQ